MSRGIAAGGIGQYTPSIELFNVTITSVAVASGYLHFKAPKNLLFSTIKAQIYEKNGIISGFLEIDIKKNNTPDDTGMTSIFSIKPKTDFSTNVDYAEFTGTLSSSGVNLGQYLRLDITQIPAGFSGTIQVIAYAE